MSRHLAGSSAQFDQDRLLQLLTSRNVLVERVVCRGGTPRLRFPGGRFDIFDLFAIMPVVEALGVARIEIAWQQDMLITVQTEAWRTFTQTKDPGMFMESWQISEVLTPDALHDHRDA